MQSFTDAKSRKWQIQINVGTLKRVRALTGVDLANIISLEPGKKPNIEILQRLSEDPVLLVDVLYAVCKPEADTLGITDEAFGEAMAGDSIIEAGNALLDGVIDFFPVAKRRVLSKILTAARRFEKEVEANVEQMISSGVLDKTLDNALAQLNKSSATVQAFSE